MCRHMHIHSHSQAPSRVEDKCLIIPTWARGPRVGTPVGPVLDVRCQGECTTGAGSFEASPAWDTAIHHADRIHDHRLYLPGGGGQLCAAVGFML
jgi:hypothetical protein